MKRKQTRIDVSGLTGLRDAAYGVFIEGHGAIKKRFDRSSSLECRRAALIFALNGNFPEAFELFKCHSFKRQKDFLMRLIASSRVSLPPHEERQSKNLDDFGFLLWRGYFDAARWLIRRGGVSDKASYSIRLYERTGLPEDLAAARLAVRRRKEFGDLLSEAEALALLTKDWADIDFLRELIDAELKGVQVKRIDWLLRAYENFKRKTDLEAVIIAAEALNFKEAKYWWYLVDARIECWRKISKVSRSIRVKNGLAEAKRLKLMAEQEEERVRCQNKKRFFADPELCINVASNHWLAGRDGKIIEYLGQALKLIGELSGPERLRLLVRLTDTIDEILKRSHRWVP